MTNDESYDFYFTGDFNLPAIDWERHTIFSGGTLDV